MFDVPKTISKLLEYDEEAVYLGSSQHISSDVFPLIAIYQ